MTLLEEPFADHDGLCAEAYNEDQNLIEWEGHDDFDRTLLHEAGQLDTPLSVFDESRIEKRERPWGEQQRTRSRHGKPLAQRPWHVTERMEYDTGGIQNDQMQPQEELRAKRLIGNTNGVHERLVHASGPSFGYSEEQEHFTGFARPHILY